MANKGGKEEEGRGVKVLQKREGLVWDAMCVVVVLAVCVDILQYSASTSIYPQQYVIYQS